MAGAIVASAILQVVFEKLASGIIKEVGALWRVQRGLDRLKSTLSTIQEVLEDAEGRAVNDKPLNSWLAELRDAAYDTDDLLNKLEEVFWWKSEHNTAQLEGVSCFYSCFKRTVFPFRMARKIKEATERFDALVAKGSRFLLERRSATDCRAEIGDRMTVSAVTASEIYGRDDDRENILTLLKSSSNENIGVIPIVGIGGLGKTTLAQLAFKNARDYFDLGMWVYVSMDFDMKRVTAAAIETATGEQCDLTELESMGHRLRQILREKKFLLVLDDVWDENPTKWEQFREFLRGGEQGSKIIVTTRSDKVASIMGTVTPYHLGGLSKDHCWMLFRRRAFGIGGREETPSLVRIGKEIVDKCAGVPLAAKALGSLMRFKSEESEWLAVKESDIWRLSEDDNQILPSLRLSYYHLSPRLKKCFAYCALFPKGHIFDKEVLIAEWIAQGFVPSSSHGSTAVEDVGNKYFNNLLWLSFFQDVEEDPYTGILTCKMHDLVNDLAQFVASDEVASAQTDRVTSIARQCRFASLTDLPETNEISLYFLNKLRALHLSGYGIVPDFVRRSFRKTQCLRVLSCQTAFFDLRCSIKMLKNLRYFCVESRYSLFLSESIGSLRNLHTLILSGHLQALPDSIGRLQNLRRVRLHCPLLESLPESFGKLQNLQALMLSAHLTSLPESFGNLTNLQSLSLSECELVALPESIGGLHKLRVLSLRYFLHLESVPDSICNLVNLRALALRYLGRLHELPRSLSNLVNLESLELDRTSLFVLPEGIGNMSNLTHLKVADCISLGGMPQGIGRLDNLRTLTWFVVGSNDYASIAELERLNLIGDRLFIKGLDKVATSMEAGRANLKEKHNLRSLTLEWTATSYTDREAEEAMAVLEVLLPSPSLEELTLQHYRGATFPSWMIRPEEFLPNLVSITLANLERCVHLPPLGLLPSLKVVEIHGMLAVVHVGREFYGSGSGPFFPKLQILKLTNLPNLEEWSMIMTTDLHGGQGGGREVLFPCLTEVIIENCPNLRAMPSFPPSVRVQHQ